MIWVETPSNPLLKLVDLQMVAEVARAKGLLAVADNTFASPWVQRPSSTASTSSCIRDKYLQRAFGPRTAAWP